MLKEERKGKDYTDDDYIGSLTRDLLNYTSIVERYNCENLLQAMNTRCRLEALPLRL